MASATAEITRGRGLTRLRRIEEPARTAPPPAAAPKRTLRRRLLRWFLGGAALLGAGSVLWYLQGRVVAIGIVEGETLTLTAPARVVVQELYVEPGQWCEAGVPLARLSAKDVEAERRVLEAQLSQARGRLNLVEHGAEIEDLQLGRRLDDRDRLAAELAAAEAAVAAAEAKSQHARREFDVLATLWEQGQGGDRELDRAETEAIAADAELAGARALLEGMQRRLQRQRELVPESPSGDVLRQGEVALLRDGVREAEERLRQFDIESGTRTIVAPFRGRVDRVHVKSGSHREEGDALLSVYDPASLYVLAYVAPADREDLYVGQTVGMYPLDSGRPIVGVIGRIHDTWVPIPAPVRATMNNAEVAVTMRIDCDEVNRALLAPGMVVKAVCKGR